MITYYGETFEDYNTPKATPDHPIYSHFLYPYLLKHIIHDWDDTACLRILKAIRSAMAPGARLLIVEQVIPPGNAPFPGKLLDLNMLVMTEGGRERTAAEYTSLLDRAERQLSRIIPTPSPVSVVEAVHLSLTAI